MNALKEVSSNQQAPQHTLQTSQKIDLVYLWCDGNDPKFNKQRIETLKRLNLPWNEDSLGTHRYADNDEIRYSLRSVHQYLPWINHIYIVTNDQRPNWLADHPKVSIVDHKKIIPHNLLPTFNSTVIEMFIHRIPELNEKFIYLNDDLFINAPLTPEYFFHENQPVIRMKKGDVKVPPQSLANCRRLLNDPNVSDFRKIQLRAWELVCERYGHADWLVCSHTVDSYTKTICSACEVKYPKMFELNRSPFREGTQVQQRLLVNLEMIFGMGMPYQLINDQLTFWTKHFGYLFNQSIDCFEGTECDKNRNRILKLKPKVFCLNADIRMVEKERQKSKEFFEKLFPKASPFEIK